MDNIPIEKTNVYQYLGIDLSISGNFNCALRTIKEKALCVLFKLKQFNFRNNIKISLMLFNSLILPILKYFCEVWGPFLFSKLKPQTFNTICDNIIPEKVHIKFCKYILGTNKFTSNDATRGELGRYQIAIEIIVHSVKYWLSLKSMLLDLLLIKVT